MGEIFGSPWNIIHGYGYAGKRNDFG